MYMQNQVMNSLTLTRNDQRTETRPSNQHIYLYKEADFWWIAITDSLLHNDTYKHYYIFQCSVLKDAKHRC